MQAADFKVRFGTAVRSWRKRLGLSQEQLAERADLHRTYIADVERGARNPSLGSIEKLARALGISVPALFPHAAGFASGMSETVVDIVLAESEAESAQQALRSFSAASLSNPIHLLRDGKELLEFVFGTGRYADHTRNSRPKIILLDLNLPGPGALQVLRELKDNKQSRMIPVVVLTASPNHPDVAESLRLGADASLVRPVDFDRLAGLVRRLKLGWAVLRSLPSAPAGS